jgi:hypothetical protein
VRSALQIAGTILGHPEGHRKEVDGVEHKRNGADGDKSGTVRPQAIHALRIPWHVLLLTDLHRDPHDAEEREEGKPINPGE